MSFFGTPDVVIDKLKHYLHHSEYNTPEITDYERIERVMREGHDVLGRNAFKGADGSTKFVEIADCTDDVPNHILQHKSKFGYMVPC